MNEITIFPKNWKRPGIKTHLTVFKKQHFDPASFIEILTLVTDVKDLFTAKY